MIGKRRRPTLVLVLVLLLVGGLLLVPSIRWPVYGWLRGEAFYQGLPTSYWRAEIARVDEWPTLTDQLLERIGMPRPEVHCIMRFPAVQSAGSSTGELLFGS